MKIPDDIDDDNAVLCTDAYPTGYQAAEMGDIKPGETVFVFGAGPVGLFAAKCAWFFGAGRVVIVDRQEYRLEFARKFAQCETVNFDEHHDMVLLMKKMTDGVGPDVVIDAVGCEAFGNHMQRLTGVKIPLQAGAATVAQWCINGVRKGGKVSVVGVYGPTVNMVPLGNIVNKGLTIRANQASVKRNLPRLIEHIQAGRINPKDIITHRLPLEEVAEGYRIFAQRLDNCIKTVLIPPRASH
jgi:threonine dehydrogenase-like Zn-dependent dehydrogenase